MKHLIHNNIDYIIWEETSEQLELVSTVTGEVSKFASRELADAHRYFKDLPIEPSAVAFPERPQSFVQDLQQRRITYLREAQSSKRTDKGPRVKKEPGEKQPRKPRTTKNQKMLQELIAQKLGNSPGSDMLSDIFKRL